MQEVAASERLDDKFACFRIVRAFRTCFLYCFFPVLTNISILITSQDFYCDQVSINNRHIDISVAEGFVSIYDNDHKITISPRLNYNNLHIWITFKEPNTTSEILR